MKLLRALTVGLRRPPVRDLSAFRGALAAGAAYLAQGASYSYIRARSGLMGPRLMQDEAFGRGMERCKWEGYAAVAQDLVLAAEAELRGRAEVPEAVWCDLYRAVLEAEPVPEHRRPGGWGDRIDEFARRLAVQRAGPAPALVEIAVHGGSVIVEYAPVEDAIREFDREMVVNNTVFRFVDHWTDLRRRVDWAALARELAAAGGPGAESATGRVGDAR